MKSQILRLISATRNNWWKKSNGPTISASFCESMIGWGRTSYARKYRFVGYKVVFHPTPVSHLVAIFFAEDELNDDADQMIKNNGFFVISIKNPRIYRTCCEHVRADSSIELPGHTLRNWFEQPFLSPDCLYHTFIHHLCSIVICSLIEGQSQMTRKFMARGPKVCALTSCYQWTHKFFQGRNLTIRRQKLYGKIVRNVKLFGNLCIIFALEDIKRLY